MSNQEAANEAMSMLKQAFKVLSPEEIKTVKSIQKECEEALKAGTIKDAQLEFCYCVKMSPDRINHTLLMKACDAYIAACE